MRILGIALLVAALVTALAELALAKLILGASWLMFIVTMGFGYAGNAVLSKCGKMSWKLLALLDAIVLVLYIVIGLSLLNRSRG